MQNIRVYKLLRKSTPQGEMVAAFESNVEILEMSAPNTSTLLPVIGLYHVSISYEEFSEGPCIYHFCHSSGILCSTLCNSAIAMM